MNQCTLEEKNSEVRCHCTDIIKTAAKLNVNKKESKPEVDVGDQDADDAYYVLEAYFNAGRAAGGGGGLSGSGAAGVVTGYKRVKI